MVAGVKLPAFSRSEKDKSLFNHFIISRYPDITAIENNFMAHVCIILFPNGKDLGGSNNLIRYIYIYIFKHVCRPELHANEKCVTRGGTR